MSFDYPDNTIAVFDLDGTLTRRDTYLAILLHSVRLNPGTAPRLARLSLTALRFKLGRIDNTALKTEFLRELMAGLSEKRLERVVDSFLQRLFASGFRAEGLAMLNRHQAAGHDTVLLSASPDFYVEEIARRLRFVHCLCTRTVRRLDRSLSGELQGGNCYGEEKLVRLEHHFGESFQRRYFVGYADHVTDLPLLRRLDAGVLVNPKQSVWTAAKGAGLQVVEWR